MARGVTSFKSRNEDCSWSAGKSIYWQIWTPARLMKDHQIRFSVDLMFWSPPERNEEVIAEYAQQLSDSLELAHSLARNKLRITAQRIKNKNDVNASKTRFSRGDNVCLYCPQRDKGLSRKLQKQWKELILLLNQSTIWCIRFKLKYVAARALFIKKGYANTLDHILKRSLRILNRVKN